jgi:hypothetical protein
LRSAKRPGLYAGEEKFVRAYDLATRDYTKRKNLDKHRNRNPSLNLFIVQLNDLQGRQTVPAGDLPEPQEASTPMLDNSSSTSRTEGEG